MAEHAVDEPRLRSLDRVHLPKRDLQLAQGVVAGLIDARVLARGPDEESAEQVRQRRMVVPKCCETAQQIRTTEEWTIGRSRTAQHDVIAAAGAGVSAIEHELLGAQPRQPRLLIERSRDVDEFVP